MRTTGPEHRHTPSQDGLNLHWLDWAGTRDSMPVVCLPGLARTADDFINLAQSLAARRRVIAIDYRGRGGSDWARDWTQYSIPVEQADILAVLDAAGIARAIVVGTSRGGLHAMVLAATRPDVLHAVVLNDIGPVIEAAGLDRIRGYVGKLPAPRSWDDAVTIAKQVMGAQFTGLDDAQWLAYARLTFAQTGAGFLPRYDPALMHTLDVLDTTKPLPDMWTAFETLAPFPLLVLRGENSDLLSRETLVAMASRHPACETFIVPGEGHAPLLLDAATIEVLASFVTRASP